MKTDYKFISDILLEAACDPRIENGIPNLQNPLHVEVIAEGMFDRGISPQIVAEVVNALQIKEAGKHPERQAYNKEGWLVTFPSPAYKQAAIQKGTHFGSDPTHGKGGMNVYYKKKGKQARIQQKPTQTEPGEQQPAPQPTKPTQPAQAPQGSPQQEPEATTDGQPSGDNSGLPKSGGDSDGDTINFASQYEKDPDSLPKSDATEEPGPQGGTPEQPPAQVPAPVAPPAPNFVNISVEFAKSKGWNPTPYGEWRTPTGEPSAIVALSGEVVPMQSNDRDELKLLANKKST